MVWRGGLKLSPLHFVLQPRIQCSRERTSRPMIRSKSLVGPVDTPVESAVEPAHALTHCESATAARTGSGADSIRGAHAGLDLLQNDDAGGGIRISGSSLKASRQRRSSLPRPYLPISFRLFSSSSSGCTAPSNRRRRVSLSVANFGYGFSGHACAGGYRAQRPELIPHAPDSCFGGEYDDVWNRFRY